MKTYEQILNEVIEHELHNVNPSTVDIKKRAAKEYAKQWVNRLAKAMNKNQGYGSVHPESIVEDLKKEIDVQ